LFAVDHSCLGHTDDRTTAVDARVLDDTRAGALRT
jgi:hypothetical protein